MISLSVQGDLAKTTKFLKFVGSGSLYSDLNGYAKRGAAALASVTPVESGATAASWSYNVSIKRGVTTISWTNSHVVAGVPVVILLQYGHGTGTGGYVQGRDFINPAIRPLFDEISEAVWKKVTSA